VPLSSYGEFRRGGQGDERRRRVLTDTLGDSLDGDAPARTTARRANRITVEPKSAHYGDATFMDHPLRVTDLVPRRLTRFGLLFALGLAVIAGLELLHAWIPTLARYTGGRGLTAFDLRGSDSLAAWVSSSMLSLAGLTATLVYNVRRYRNDDYGGRYRIWLWAAMCCFLASVDVTATFHDAIRETMSRLSGTRVFGDGTIWWLAPWLFLLGGVGLRLVVDMCECRLSTTVFAGGVLAYAFSLALRFGLPLAVTSAVRVMVEQGANLVGGLLILLAVGLHARYVILDAEGLIHSENDDEADDEPEQEAEDDSVDEIPIVNRSKPLRTDLLEPRWGPPQPAHPSPQPPMKKPAVTLVSSTPTSSNTPPKLAGGLGQNTSSAQQKLSKADKKALRKRLLEMRHGREQ
jgi:hypothetical protein